MGRRQRLVGTRTEKWNAKLAARRARKAASEESEEESDDDDDAIFLTGPKRLKERQSHAGSSNRSHTAAPNREVLQ